MLLQRRESGATRVRAKVLDFGLASVARASSSSALAIAGDASAREPAEGRAGGALIGTPRYMSPEQFRGEATDPRTDQFSFAVSLYEALYGERPFPGETFESLRRAVLAGELRPAPRLSSAPAWARETIARALAVYPEERWATMAELLDALENHPDRTVDPELDRTVALRQRLWMLLVISVGCVTLFGVLLYLHAYVGAALLEDYAFWSKVVFASAVALGLYTWKHVFESNRYNRRVYAMFMTLALTAIATSTVARALGLSAEHTDQFVLIGIAAIFGQASASLDRWFLWVTVVGALGLVISFVAPFAASISLALCVLSGSGLAVFFWSRRSRRVRRDVTRSLRSLGHANQERSAPSWPRTTPGAS